MSHAWYQIAQCNNNSNCTRYLYIGNNATSIHLFTLAEPTFQYEPADLVVRPFNESSRAAFSCSVLGIRPIVSIQWYFEMMQFGSEIGHLMGPMNGMLTNGTFNITIFTGANVTATRTSVLLLENVGNQHEGLYRCQVTFGDGRVLTSRNASLMFDGKINFLLNS